jgi:hypothetical protein
LAREKREGSRRGEKGVEGRSAEQEPGGSRPPNAAHRFVTIVAEPPAYSVPCPMAPQPLRGSASQTLATLRTGRGVALRGGSSAKRLWCLRRSSSARVDDVERSVRRTLGNHRHDQLSAQPASFFKQSPLPIGDRRRKPHANALALSSDQSLSRQPGGLSRHEIAPTVAAGGRSHGEHRTGWIEGAPARAPRTRRRRACRARMVHRIGDRAAGPGARAHGHRHQRRGALVGLGHHAARGAA